MQTVSQLNEVAQHLSAVRHQLPHGQQSFADSLITQQLSGKKPLSEKQEYWLHELLKKATNPPKPTTVDLGVDVSGIVKLFVTAGSKLKWPTITLALGVEERPLVLTRAGKSAKYPGSVNVKVKTYNGYDWLGRVLEDGTWMPGRLAEDYPILEDFLRQFAESPAEIAAEYGKKTGRCCFCNLKLSDARSLFVGYGKTCAGHYNLPYPAMSEVN